MIRSDGSIKLIDFGYSLNVNSPKGSPSKFCGTPYYIPPEYLRKDATLGTIYINSV
jgi:serine/threonine protein kinase